MSGYGTIVADPPWPMSRAHFVSWRPGSPSGGSTRLDYPTMSLADIAAMPVSSLAADDAHLFIWTTQRYLCYSSTLPGKWGFAYSKVLVWCKPPTGFSLGGQFGNACEFIVYARRGKPENIGKVSRDWWEWPRAGGHSAKPEAFLDIVEQTCPGPYLELFARRNRLGWDTFGNEALGHVEIGAA